MSILVPFNGVNYIIPTPGETGWGSNLDSFFVAIGAGCLQKIGGNFLLASEVDFGASFGLKSLYYKSETPNISSTGVVRLANAADSISWRNAANNADLALTVNASNQLSFNGVPIESNALTSAHILVGNASNIATDVAMSGNIAIDNTGSTTIQSGVIVNSMVNAAAAIAYSKLALTGSIVNADINASAAIAYSKLNLTASIVNADISASAAIAYSKLALSNSIVNADINSSAAIVYSKLSLTNGIVNGDINSSAAIAYSKLNLSASIVNADIASAAAIVRSKLASTETTDVTYASGKGTFWTDSGTNTVKLTAPTTITSTYTLKWPIAQGASNQYLTNDGSGNLSWTNAAGTGTVNSGTAGRLSLYPTSTNAVSDTYVQNTHNITLAIATQAARSVDLALTIPNPGNAVTAANVVLDQGAYTIAGQFTFSSALLGINGTTTTPTYSFTNSTNSGLYLQAVGHPSIVAAGTEVFRFTSAELIPLVQFGSVSGTVGAPQYSFDADLTSGMYLQASGHPSISAAGTEVFRFTSTELIPLKQIGSVSGTKGAPQYSFDADLTTGSYLNAANDFRISANSTDVIIAKSSGVAVLGTNTNNNATSGFVGETVSSTAAATNFPATTNFGDLTSISLTAGDWLISIFTNFQTNLATTSQFTVGISTTTGNSSTGLTLGDNEATTIIGSGDATITTRPIAIPFYRASLTGTTTYYLKYSATFSAGTPALSGRITALRIR